MEDVESFLQARWNGLVRTLVLSGCTLAEAEPLAIAACARVWPAWRAARKREEDVDVLVYTILLKQRGRAWAKRHPDRAVEGAAHLAAVLTQGAGLDDYQVEQVLRGVPGAGDGNPRAVLGEEWDDVYRGPAPLQEIRQAVRRTRRRRIVAGAAVLAAALVVTAVVLVTRPDAPPAPKPPEPPVPQNPIGIAWSSNGVLHLDRTDIDTPGLVSLAQAGADPYGAVYGDDSGQVVQVDPDGGLDVIGRTRPGDPLVGTADGIVAWVEPGRFPGRGLGRGPRGGDARLVAWDTAAGAEVGFVTVDRNTRLVAIDDGTVYAIDGAADSAFGLSWRIGDTTVRRIAGELLDVSGGVELRSDLVRRFVIPPGQPAQLSPDGSLALTWLPGESFAELVSPTTSSYSPPALAFEPRVAVLDGRFTPDGDIVLVTSRVYLLSMGRDDVSGSSGRSPYADLITCSTSDGSCTTVIGRDTFAGDSSNTTPIILAR